MATWNNEVWGCLASNSTPWTTEEWSNVTFVTSLCGPLQSDPDIAGVGVVVSFVATCIITIVSCLLKAVCLGILSKRDTFFHRKLWPNGRPRWEWMTRKRAGFWNDIFGKLILGLADQQMVTGFAILVAAFHNMKHMTAYHFYVVTNIAAFSVLTLSISLLVVFDIIHRSLALHTLRVIVYSVVLGLFYAAAFSSYNLTGLQGYKAACPAYCSFNTNSTHSWYITIIFAGFPVYAFIIIDLGRKYLHHLEMLDAVEIPECERPYNCGLRHWQWLGSWLWWHGFMGFRVAAWIYCIVELGFALWTVFYSRNTKDYKDLGLVPDFNQDRWGFGQLTAIILIALPFLAVLQEWRDKWQEENLSRRNTLLRHRLPSNDSRGGSPKQSLHDTSPNLINVTVPTQTDILAAPNPAQYPMASPYSDSDTIPLQNSPVPTRPRFEHLQSASPVPRIHSRVSQVLMSQMPVTGSPWSNGYVALRGDRPSPDIRRKPVGGWGELDR